MCYGGFAPEDLQQVTEGLFQMIQWWEVERDVKCDQFYVEIRIHQHQ